MTTEAAGTVLSSVSGTLSPSARARAVREALPLVATYFAKSDRPYVSVGVPGRRDLDDEVAHLDRFTAAMTLRIRLTAAPGLIDILRRVALDPSFRYSIVSASHAGQVRGRLDVNRYLVERTRIAVPRLYPVRVPERNTETPENLMAELAALRVADDLDLAVGLLGLSMSHNEYRNGAAYREELLGLAAKLTGGSRTARGHGAAVSDLLEQTERRVETNRIPVPEPYIDLAGWVRRHMVETPALRDSDVLEAAFYDKTFDTTLFELWLAAQLRDAITERFGRPFGGDRTLGDRRAGWILGRWRVPAGILTLYFQAPLSSLTGAANRWLQPGGSRLRGTPDIGLCFIAESGERHTVHVDAKLRQRGGGDLSPEIYKLLGYFANDGSGSSRTGAIVFHAPAGFRPAGRGVARRRWRTDDGGRLEAVGVDPLDGSGTAEAMQVLVDLALPSLQEAEASASQQS